MPRTERPLDSEDTELGRFAADLRKVRDKAGKPSYRALASRAHYSAATLSDAAGGRKLPTLAVTLAYVKACDGDEQEWEQRWRAIAAPPEPAGEAPYVGLKAFQKEDADRFFGREKLTAKLVDLVASRPLVGVFGASGSGKSSLLRAGLLPRLDRALVFTPGVHPVDECAVRLAQATGHSAVALKAELEDPAALGLIARQHDLVLVVDQFEEIFTLCGPEQRDWFVHALVTAPHVVIGVRADFYGHIGRHPELVEALEGAQLLVGPMTTDELRRAIIEPARHIGATVESALVTRLVADVAGQAAALPLVQHALAETWCRRRGMALTLAGYEEAGGVEHAVARTAEAVYASLTIGQQRTARRIFLRLIALGEGTEDTKRRAARSDLDSEVLERLAAARLVTLSEPHAELTHEALIRSWPRLRDWIAEDRSALRVHHQLTEVAAEWDGHDRDLLYKGIRLAQAGELDLDSLTEAERVFLTASQADGRRRARLTRVVVSVLSVLVLLLAGTVVFAMRKSDEAADRSRVAVAAAAAAQARWLINSGEVEQGRAVQVALAAYRVASNAETRDVLLSAYALGRRKDIPRPVTSTDVRFRKIVGGRFFARSDDTSETELWDVRSHERTPSMTVPGSVLYMSGDNRRAIVRRNGVMELMDVSDAARSRKLADVPASGFTLVANDSLDVIADVVADRRLTPKVWIYDGSGGWREVVVPGDKEAGLVRLSPDGRTLAVQRLDGFWQLWRLEGGAARLMSETPLGTGPMPYDFSPDGRFLAVVSSVQAVVQVWDVSDLAKPTRRADFPLPSASGVPVIKFSPDSRRLLVAADRSAHIWDLEREDRPARIAAFEAFPDDVTGADHWPQTNEFVVILAGRITWPLSTDVDKAIEEECRSSYVELTDGAWSTYFPGVERVPVC